MGKGGGEKSGERVSIGDGAEHQHQNAGAWGWHRLCVSVYACVLICTVTENAKHFLTWSPERVPVVFPTSLNTKMVIRDVP